MRLFFLCHREVDTDVDLTDLTGITVREMDWTALLKDAQPDLDALARYIPADQHALFFPSFNAMARMIGVMPFHGLRFEGKRFDCGDKAGFLEANIAYALAREDLGDDVRLLLRKYL